MALTEETILGHRDVLSNGVIQFREDTVIKRDGEEISRTFKRFIAFPGQNLDNRSDEVKAFCALIHTPEVIETYQAAEAARE